MADNSATIDQLTINVKANTKKAVDNIDRLWKSIYSLYEACTEFNGSNLQQSVNGLGDTFERLGETIKRTATFKLDRFTNSILDANQKLTETEERLSDNLNDKTEELAKSVKDLGETIAIANESKSSITLKQSSGNPFTDSIVKMVSKQIQEDMSASSRKFLSTNFTISDNKQFAKLDKKLTNLSFASAIEKSNNEALSSEVDKASKKTNTIFDKLEKRIAKIKEKATSVISSIKNKMASLDKNVGVTKTSSQKEGGFSSTKLGQLFNSVGRIFVYRLIRTTIKVIGDAFKRGIDNLYKYSLTAGTKFASSMDSIATSFAYLESSIGSIVEPLVNMVAPLIEKIADFFVEINNEVAQFIAQISGADTWSKAIKNQERYNATLKRTLLSIDEINMLNGDSTNSNNLYTTETLNTSTELVSNATKLKTAFEDMKKPITEMFTTFDSLGTLLKDTISPIVNDVLMPLVGWTLGDLTTSIIENITASFKTMESIIEPIKDNLDDFNKDVLQPIGTFLKEKIQDALNTIKTNIESIGTYFKDNKNEISIFLSSMTSLLKTLWEIVEPLVGGLLSLINALTAPATKTGLDLLTVTLETLTSAMQVLEGFLSGSIEKFISGLLIGLLPIVNTISFIINAIGSLSYEIQNKLTGTKDKWVDIPTLTMESVQSAVHDMLYGSSNTTTEAPNSSINVQVELSTSSITNSQVRLQKREGGYNGMSIIQSMR